MCDKWPVASSHPINREAVEQVEKFKYLRVVFTSDGKSEEEIDQRMGMASCFLHELSETVAVKAEQSLKTKDSVFKWMFILKLIDVHKPSAMTDNLPLRLQATERQ
ncbi:unnamed protein product [Soboliphyme baturini]|uniref:MT domain-containing protein n=1 Tax=Soboliphyme baturini TaxID=241478 RepID=A0A183ILW0_9BILA|nr:unnamed protein product [Soboliphyme baturini]